LCEDRTVCISNLRIGTTGEAGNDIPENQSRIVPLKRATPTSNFGVAVQGNVSVCLDCVEMRPELATFEFAVCPC